MSRSRLDLHQACWQIPSESGESFSSFPPVMPL